MTARHLTLITGGPPAAPGPSAPGPASPVALTPSAALDLERAETFLLELDAQVPGADLARMAYLAGLAEAHIANLISIIRAVAR